MERTRKTLIFGNGLGMALDCNYFPLEKAIKHVWNEPGVLSDDCKKLIRLCLPNPKQEYPSGEHDFDLLQTALISCENLKEIQKEENNGWLTDNGNKFPKEIRSFIYKVAYYFHNPNKKLPDEFINSLIGFIEGEENPPHIATLNYDNLLYGPFVCEKHDVEREDKKHIFDGYNGYMVDGFLRRGFDPENLIRRVPGNLGYYLHLHGSPLFKTKERIIKKDGLSSFQLEDRGFKSHIVLTHFEHKKKVIADSDLLRTYWEFFDQALDESKEVILFGYSGLDTHLNERIEKRISRDFNSIKIRVIEWNDPKYEENSHDRKNFWKGKLGASNSDILEYSSQENILDFRDWKESLEIKS